jgi:hypothetical protein
MSTVTKDGEGTTSKKGVGGLLPAKREGGGTSRDSPMGVPSG